MERFSAREHLLMGHHSSRRSFGSPKLTPRNSDLDFNDVFGGPPRRSSLHEWRNSLSEAMNSNSSGGGEEEEETISSRNPWSGLSEKPVFGEETLNRRSNPSDEFFDDIFKGDEYSNSTPSKPSRDPLFSSPSSRVLSPARPLPPQSEPFGGSSLPLPLSLPTKLAKGIDQAFASPSHSPFNRKQSAASGLGFLASPIASKVSTQVVQGRDDFRNDSRPFFGKSASSREFYPSSEESSIAAIKTDKDAEDYLGKSLSSLEVNNNSNVQFHFSIYKWVSKGVPLTMMTLRGRNNFSSKGRDNTERIESELSGPVSQVVEHHSVGDDMPAVDESLECENQDKSSGLKTTKKDTIGSSTFIVEVASAKPESEPVASFMSHKAGKGLKPDSVASGAPRDMGLGGVTEKEVPVLMEQSCTVELKPLYSAFKDESNRQGKEKMVKQPGVKEDAVERIDASVRNVDDGKKVKKLTGKRNLINLSEKTSSSLQDSSTSFEDKPIRNKVKGKVKDFVTIFNQDAPSKPINVKNRESSGVKGVSASKVEDEVSILPTKADEKENVTNMKNKGTFTEALAMEGEISEKSEKTVKPDIGINKTPPRKIYTPYERNDASTSCSESVPDILEAEVGKVEESHYEDLQGNCLVEELSPEMNKLSQTRQNLEEIQAADARVRKWSNGKQGNIRSLLSTLQYVLWPESGWKPVPLVDIIEGNSVKRAYQKALLCLHPDKLQQKGAAPHQKYIAEKVFDILQDAWTHFNLVGSF